MLTRMAPLLTRMARMLTRMTRWLAGSHIIHTPRETVIYFPLKMHTTIHKFLQIQLVGKISASLFPLELVQKQNNGFRMLF